MNFKEFFEGQLLFNELVVMEYVVGRDYAVDMLQKITKVAEYLSKSRLNRADDLDRFEKFLDMIANESPKLGKSIKAIQADITKMKMNNVVQQPRRFNYDK